MIAGIVGSSQYVLPMSDIKTLAIGTQNTTTNPGARLNPVSDGESILVFDIAESDIMKANPYPTNTFSDVYTTQLNSVTVNNGQMATYENGKFFVGVSGSPELLVFDSSFGTPTQVSLSLFSSILCVRWMEHLGGWIGLSASGFYHSSTDGTSWTTRGAISSGSSFYDAATDGTTILAVGDSGIIRSSTSTALASLIWSTATTAFGTSTVRAIAYNGTYWVATGNAGKLGYSTNPTSGWTLKTITDLGAVLVHGIVFHMGRWVVSTRSNTGLGVIIRSDTDDPSGNWTTITTTGNAPFSRIFSDGRYIYGYADGGTFVYSR